MKTWIVMTVMATAVFFGSIALAQLTGHFCGGIVAISAPAPTATPTPITFIARSENFNSGDHGVSVNITSPTTTQAGDVMLVQITSFNDSTATSCGTPAGWTLLSNSHNQNGANPSLFGWLFAKIASVNGATLFTFCSPMNTLNIPSAYMRVYRYSGLPIDAAGASPSGGGDTTGTTFAAPTLASTAVDNEMFVAFWQSAILGVGDVATTCPGDLANINNESGECEGEKLITPTGVPSTGTASVGTTSVWLSQAVTLKPTTLTAIAIAPDPGSVIVNHTLPYAATGTYSNTLSAVLPNNTLTWTTDAASVCSNCAAVNSVGVATGLAVGTAHITASQ